MNQDDSLSSSTRVQHLAVLEGVNMEIIEKIIPLCGDYEHALFLRPLPDSFQTKRAKDAAIRGDLAGILYSNNLKFVEICLRVAYDLGPREPLPRMPTERLELTGKPLKNLLEKAEKYSAALTGSAPLRVPVAEPVPDNS